MEIAVVHHSLNIPGGAERLCLSVLEALRQEGHSVTLVTLEKTDWKIVQKNFGKVIFPDREEYITCSRFSKDLRKVPIASAYFANYILQLLAKRSRRKHDLIINTFGDVVNSIADITYVHFPLRAASELSQIPAFTDKILWQALAPLYSSFSSILDRIYPGELLTNSEFMRGIIKKVLKRDSKVVYPPVDVATFSSQCSKGQKNNGTVAVISSYTPKRHLERVPLIAKRSKFAKFIVMGKAGEYSLPTLGRLRRSIKELHVEERVELLTNVPFHELLDVLSRAKVYLHIMPYDHFGISVVEAMASGCVPVVHRSGGPWADILDGRQGFYGFSYATPEEASGLIDAIVTDENLRSKVASRALYRAKRFDRTVFMREMVKVVNQVAE